MGTSWASLSHLPLLTLRNVLFDDFCRVHFHFLPCLVEVICLSGDYSMEIRLHTITPPSTVNPMFHVFSAVGGGTFRSID